MSLIVEDGTGLSAAESYISTADADTYIAAYKMPSTAWSAATTATKEIAARQATQYLDGAYAWLGEQTLTTQALRWPRSYTGTIHDATIPERLKRACAEVMLLIVEGETINKNVSRDDRVKSASVDVISVTYEDGAAQQPSYPEVNRLVAEFVRSSNRLVRG